MGGQGFGCKISLLLGMTVAIFGFFAGLMNFTEGAAETARVKRQRNDVIQDMSLLAVATREYAAGHGGRLPPMESASAFKKALYPALISEEDHFVRFGDNVPYKPNALISRKPLTSFHDLSGVLVLMEPEGGLQTKKEIRDGAPPFRATAFLDGAVQSATTSATTNQEPIKSQLEKPLH